MEDTWVDLKHEWVGLVRAGVRWKFIEGDLEVATYSMRFLDDEEVKDIHDLTVNLGFALYSYRGKRVRLRHGLRLGAVFHVGIRCQSDDPSDCYDLKLGTYPLPLVQFHVVDLSFRLADRVWLELSPLTFGMLVPYFYMISVGVRWEAVRLR